MPGKKVLVIAAYGPGISSSVVDVFAAQGFSIALFSRTQAKLDTAVEALKAKGVEAAGFVTDITKPDDVKASLAKVADTLGPVTVLFWNGPCAQSWGDVLTMDPSRITADFNSGILSLLVALQVVTPGFEGQEGAAVLITGGGFAFAADKPEFAGMAAAWGGIGTAFIKAAAHNLSHTLSALLKPKGVRVGEVVVTGVVSGSEFAEIMNNPGTIKAEDVAAAFWKLYSEPEGPVSAIV